MTSLALRVERQEVVPLAIPREGGPSYEAVLLVLEAEGLTGYGEAPAVPGRGPGLADLVSELASGGLPASAAARCAWETAWLDLEGKARGLPVADVLGARSRDGIECNALVTAGPAAQVAAEIERLLALGFTTFKLKSANRGGGVDLERLGAARWACGRSSRLRIDFSGGLSLAQAESVLPGLARFGLELVEQPLPAAAPATDWSRLMEAGGVAVAADESLADPALARELAALGAGLAIKLATVGGPRAALDLSRLGSGPLVLASSYETSIGLAAALHTACAGAAEPLACGLATAALLETDPAMGLVWVGSRLLVPDRPGLGVELDPTAIDAYRLDR